MIDGLPKNTPFVRPSSSLPEIIIFFAGISVLFLRSMFILMIITIYEVITLQVAVNDINVCYTEPAEPLL